MAHDTTIGIDFGTSTTLVATRQGEQLARVLPIGKATSWMATVAAVGPAGHLIIGEDAEALSERSIIRSVKTALAADTERLVRTEGDGTDYETSVQAVVTAVLREAADRSTAAGLDLGARPVRMACPAQWVSGPRHRLIAMAREAGLNVRVTDLLDEPIAAGVSWVMNRLHDSGQVPEGRVVVFDGGGGTLDVAVMTVSPGNPPEITVLSSMSMAEAGDRLDATIAGELRGELADRGLVSEYVDDDVLQHLLRLAARRLKELLSVSEQARTAVGGEFSDLPPLEYTRSRLDGAFRPQLSRSLELVFGCLQAAELRARGADTTEIRHRSREHLAKEVRWVLLSGGMARMPGIRAALMAEFPDANVETDARLGAPEESVVSGLTFEEVVSDLNLNRPAFDFVVEYRSRSTGNPLGTEVVYPAFSPLYSPEEVMRGEFALGRTHYLDLAGASGEVDAYLSCRALDGSELELHVDGHVVPAIKVPLTARRTGRFKLYVDGRVLLAGSAEVMLRVERWPVIRSGSQRRALHLRQKERSPWDDRPPDWWRFK